MFKILVDADACPVKAEIIELAKKYSLKLMFITNINCNLKETQLFHFLDDKDKEQIEFIVVDNEKDAADFAIANRVGKDDIVITQDYGLASMVLAKRGNPISPYGKIIDNLNISSLLEKRHLARIERQKGVRTKGPPKITKYDIARFKKNLEILIKKILQ